MSNRNPSHWTAPPGLAAALASALLFGVTTPVAKQLLSGTNPLLIAGLLYVGSGVGVSVLRLFQDRGGSPARLTRTDWPWLAAATLAGGIVAPALLMTGLARADAAASSLLLNLEVVFTAAIAWVVFREPTSRRVVLGLLVIFVGGLVLVWPGRLASGSAANLPALLAIVAACLCWAIDNNLTRRISASDPRIIAGIKGLVAGITNTALAFGLGATLPAVPKLLATIVLGFLGYGLSLVLFILALRQLGTARTSAYFATAPFIGAAVAVAFFGQPGEPAFWLAALCMGAGVWLHVTEHHEHDHVHEALTHTHSHTHDEHHQHEHGAGWDGAEPHTHEHQHEPVRHHHAHFPDIHHQHGHG
jgi:drug/metabolite transporter (DMT)-like permease